MQTSISLLCATQKESEWISARRPHIGNGKRIICRSMSRRISGDSYDDWFVFKSGEWRLPTDGLPEAMLAYINYIYGVSAQITCVCGADTFMASDGAGAEPHSETSYLNNNILFRELQNLTIWFGWVNFCGYMLDGGEERAGVFILVYMLVGWCGFLGALQFDGFAKSCRIDVCEWMVRLSLIPDFGSSSIVYIGPSFVVVVFVFIIIIIIIIHRNLSNANISTSKWVVCVCDVLLTKRSKSGSNSSNLYQKRAWFVCAEVHARNGLGCGHDC